METPTDSSAGTIIKSDRTDRTRYTAQYKREVLDAFESSSLSAPAFAMQCGVNQVSDLRGMDRGAAAKLAERTRPPTAGPASLPARRDRRCPARRDA